VRFPCAGDGVAPPWWNLAATALLKAKFLVRDLTVLSLSSERLPRERAPADAAENPQPGAIGCDKVTAFAVVALLVVSIVTVLHIAEAFFRPVVMAFRGRHHAVAGRKLSRALPGYLARSERS
jgi:hypothetical protein